MQVRGFPARSTRNENPRPVTGEHWEMTQTPQSESPADAYDYNDFPPQKRPDNAFHARR
jgi:hypothetical protein